jgi:hypothetical protein
MAFLGVAPDAWLHEYVELLATTCVHVAALSRVRPRDVADADAVVVVHLLRLPDELLRKARRVVFWQSEQVERVGGRWAAPDLELAVRDCKARGPQNLHVDVWDYSRSNAVEVTEALAGIARVGWIPYSTPRPEALRLRALYESTSKAYDVALFATASERGHAVAKQCALRGLFVLEVAAAGMVRDRNVAACRVLLGAHRRADRCMFDAPRCKRWVDAGMPLVSEEGPASYERLAESVIAAACRLRGTDPAALRGPGALRRCMFDGSLVDVPLQL